MYDAGVLRLTIPVSEQSKPHEIKIASQQTTGRPSSAHPELDQRVVARRPTLDRLGVTVNPLARYFLHDLVHHLHDVGA